MIQGHKLIRGTVCLPVHLLWLTDFSVSALGLGSFHTFHTSALLLSYTVAQNLEVQQLTRVQDCKHNKYKLQASKCTFREGWVKKNIVCLCFPAYYILPSVFTSYLNIAKIRKRTRTWEIKQTLINKITDSFFSVTQKFIVLYVYIMPTCDPMLL